MDGSCSLLPEAAEATVKMKQILDAHTAAPFCLGYHIHNPPTKCTCLHDSLRKQDPERIRQTFVDLGQQFCLEYDRLLQSNNSSDNQQKNLQRAAKDFFQPYRTDPISETAATDRRHQQYSFHFPLLNDHEDDDEESSDGRANDDEIVFVCYHTVATIFAAVTGFERHVLLNSWFRNQERERNWSRTKANAVQILKQLAVANIPRPKNIQWDRMTQLPRCLSTTDAAHLASQFKLRKILEEKQLLVAGTPEADIEVVRPLNGKVIPLPDDILADMPVLRKAGNEVHMRNTKRWAKVRPESISSSYDGLVPDDPVRFQTLELLSKRYKRPRQAIGKLTDLFQVTLGATKIELDDPSFLKTPSHAPQACHIDFTDEEFLEHSQGRVFLSFVPLTLAGMYLQLWPPEGGPGRVLFIPFGMALLVPGDTIHGGGFLSCPLMHNLRLHFYIRINGAPAPKNQANKYLDEKLYPQSDNLVAVDSLLSRLFEMAKIVHEKRSGEERELDSTKKIKAEI